MSTEWFNKKRPGDLVLDSIDKRGMSLVSNKPIVPDWVTLPRQLGGQRVRVISAEILPCPCQKGEAQHFLLPDGVAVAECEHTGQFMWYRGEGSHAPALTSHEREDAARNTASMAYHDDPSNPSSCPAYEKHAISMGRNLTTCPCEDSWEAHLTSTEVEDVE